MTPLRRFFRHPRPSSVGFPSALATWIACAASLASSVGAADPAELAYQIEHDVMVPMRDGVALAANVYRPKQGERFPVILLRTPYGKPNDTWGDAKRYTAAGYALVAQDCRGRGKSQGAWDPFRHDPNDGVDTQRWVASQPWCNGSIGTSGGSYGGWTQWSTAADAAPQVKCMVPVVPFAEVYDDIAYPGGAFQLALLMGWGAAVAGVQLSPEKLDQAYRHLPLKTLGDQFEPKVAYITEWTRHPVYDDYWKQRGIQHRFSDVTVPTLNIGGWYDIFSKTTLELTDQVRDRSRDPAARRNQVVVIGPWAHGVGARKVGELDFGDAATVSIGDLQFQWFEYWLKGATNGVQDWAAYRLFVMGENVWRNENEWPLQRTRYTPYYLHSRGKAATAQGDGTLDATAPGNEPADTFTYDGDQPVPTVGGNNLVGATAGPYDQSKIEERGDVLVYTTSPLDQDIEVTGSVKMFLHAASSAKDTDFTAKLVDVHPDGKAFNLCDGILRARYRKGLDKPVLLEPGKVERFEIDMWVTSNLFRKGHRIRVEISSGSFPRFDRNANSGNELGSDTELLAATQTVHHDAARPSHLLLPVIPR